MEKKIEKCVSCKKDIDEYGGDSPYGRGAQCFDCHQEDLDEALFGPVDYPEW